MTPNAITPLPAPWVNPYSTPAASNRLHDSGINDAPLISRYGRFVYLVIGRVT